MELVIAGTGRKCGPVVARGGHLSLISVWSIGAAGPTDAVFVQDAARVAIRQRIRPGSETRIIERCSGFGHGDGRSQRPIGQVGPTIGDGRAADQLIGSVRLGKARRWRLRVIGEPCAVGPWQSSGGGQPLADRIGAAQSAQVAVLGGAGQEDAAWPAIQEALAPLFLHLAAMTLAEPGFLLASLLALALAAPGIMAVARLPSLAATSRFAFR